MKDNSKNLYNIRQVIELTSVSEFTLRGWELRYKAFKPIRTKTGRRHYCQNDILKIRAIKDALVQGLRIGKIAHLKIDEIHALIGERNAKAPEAKESQINEIQIILELISRFNWDKVQTLFLKNMKNLTTHDFIYKFILPMINEMNIKIQAGQMTVAEEHIISAQIKESLYHIIHTSKKSAKKGMRFVLATPENDFHEIGLLIASALLATKGIRQLYLGPNVPAREICESCILFGATQLLVTSTVQDSSKNENDYFSFINFLDRQLPIEVSLLTAGPNSYVNPLNLKRSHQLFTNFKEFESYLNNLKKKVSS
jgi:DNA-binding transcriptional MerR regulator